ncbi:TVG0372401 [Thermoplasma volcanium GSS1]|uniref:TVG0372401 protein n=1 Tax=Thermoplasma volcanium (strain ATCC 51530 / DSM 4299 / JCM 9571 / NBRC 15438 / GSS1) TaxID=273116 RepID=Q97BS0_THEVO|nr:hypothetical protein [Thermoplasma volcanium]BAB59527.1 TVG0372401 [Thermoplasma volcanium GSS1]
MTLVITDVLRYYSGDTNDEKISKLYITASRKVLGQAYDLKNGTVLQGRLMDLSVAPGKEKITETAVPGRDRLIGTKLEAYYFSAGQSNPTADRDYIFFSSKFSHILTEYAIFAEEYEVKVEFVSAAYKLKKVKLYTKGTVMDSYSEEKSEGDVNE